MTPTQAENLRILIRHMETNVSRVLNMRSIRNACGTPACAWGEACTVRALQAELGTLDNRKALGVLLVFGMDASDKLFGFDLQGKEDVPPREWATAARKVLAEHGYTMDDGFAAFKAKVLAPIDVESVSTAHGIALWPSVL